MYIYIYTYVYIYIYIYIFIVSIFRLKQVFFNLRFLQPGCTQPPSCTHKKCCSAKATCGSRSASSVNHGSGSLSDSLMLQIASEKVQTDPKLNNSNDSLSLGVWSTRDQPKKNLAKKIIENPLTQKHWWTIIVPTFFPLGQWGFGSIVFNCLINNHLNLSICDQYRVSTHSIHSIAIIACDNGFPICLETPKGRRGRGCHFGQQK